ncbi:hypothetical protein B0H16DRAFT_1559820 [Mycena metata]|uniref:N-acetyltransferase domain-containing protein n=1 Tax=Mycena metata TaxID=1033252 RepID=A0AAD7N509_9AGAR|nr:hypothetical protein B0H16DRAFT_1559820 [Mycena metata]
MSTPAVTKKPGIQPIISRMSVQEAHAAATVQLNALALHPVQLRIQPLDKRPSVSAQIEIKAQAFRDVLAGGQRRVIKAVVPQDNGVGDSEVAGVAVWMLFNEKKPQLEDWIHEEALVGVDVEFRDKRVAIMTEERNNIMGDSKYWYVSLMVVDPKYQQRGIGQALLQWGLDQADAEGLEVYLESSDDGRRLSFGWSALPDEQFEGGVLKWPALKRRSTNQGSA